MRLTGHVNQLLAHGRGEDALTLVRPLAETDKPSYEALSLQAQILRVLGRPQDALHAHERLVECFPASGAAWHDLAAAHVNLSHGPEARAAAERAIAAGFEQPETWHIVGMAATLMGDLAGSESAYVQALQLRPDFAPAVEPLCQMIWTRSGDIDQALAPVRAARNEKRPETSLILIEARTLMIAGRRPEAIALLEQVSAGSPENAQVLGMLGQFLLEEGELARAGAAMERAVALSPGPGHLTGLAAVRMAQGRAAEALPLARRATELAPLDQLAWGWLAAAARVCGDAAYGDIYDYDSLVRTYRLHAPEGWPSLDAYLADLSVALRRLHTRNIAPLEHTLRHGTQTLLNLTLSDDPAICAFFGAIEAPIRRYIDEIGDGADSLRSRRTGDFRISGAWSVLLRPNGFHVNHVHQWGWLSSAFYLETPEAAEQPDAREGWLEFGEPSSPTRPPLSPEHFVKPERGMLVLFPSYMWHGTSPYSSNDERLAIAFDVVPA